MLINLENDFLQVDIDTRGAELLRIFSKETGLDYLWNGDAKFWSYHAPVLFPVIGRVKNDTLKLDGKSYIMPKHGFARVSEFGVLEAGKDCADFCLSDTALDTRFRDAYPFDFRLIIGYELSGRRVIITYRVESTGGLLFSLGAHPALVCPLNRQERFSDYYLELDEQESAGVIPVTENGYIKRTEQPFLHGETKIPLDYKLFENDALVFSGLKSQGISLKSSLSEHGVRLDFSEFPLLGIWTKKDAGFICIEPWHGHADFDDFDGEFAEKDGVISLKAGESFQASYSVEVN